MKRYITPSIHIFSKRIGDDILKTKSVIVDDARGALGDQVIGTSWKGRNVLKAYKRPTQTQVCSQRAHRDHQKKLVAMYQANVGSSEPVKADWNKDAKPRMISGYNLFMQLGRRSKISCEPAYFADATIRTYYTLVQDISSAYMAIELTDPEYAEIIILPGEMQAGEDIIFDTLAPPTGCGPCYIHLCDARSKTLITGIPPIRDGIFNHWKPDPDTLCSAIAAVAIETF